jgi:hypothetical protein
MTWSGADGVDGEIDPGPPVSRYMWTDGTLTQTHTFAGGDTTITLNLKGELFAV